MNFRYHLFPFILIFYQLIVINYYIFCNSNTLILFSQDRSSNFYLISIGQLHLARLTWSVKSLEDDDMTTQRQEVFYFVPTGITQPFSR